MSVTIEIRVPTPKWWWTNRRRSREQERVLLARAAWHDKGFTEWKRTDYGWLLTKPEDKQ